MFKVIISVHSDDFELPKEIKILSRQKKGIYMYYAFYKALYYKYEILNTYLTLSSQHPTKMTVKGRGSSYKPVKAKVVIIIKNWKVESKCLF